MYSYRRENKSEEDVKRESYRTQAVNKHINLESLVSMSFLVKTDHMKTPPSEASVAPSTIITKTKFMFM